MRRQLGRRTSIVLGDVSEPRLGLGEKDYLSVVSQVTHIIHTAAELNLDGPISVMRRTNVNGTANVLDIAAAANADHALKRFSHVSTAYVSGGRHGQVGEQDLTDDYGFRNTYELTKFEAEKLVRKAGDHIPISIFRPGMIVGDSDTGEIRTFNTIYYPLRSYLKHRLRIVPASGSLRINIIPVDYVADSIFKLTFADEAKGQTFHLTSPSTKQPTARQLLDTTRSWARENAGVKLPRVFFVPLRASKPFTVQMLEQSHVTNDHAKGKLGELAAYLSADAIYRRDNTDKLLAPYEFDWQRSLPNLLNFALKRGLLHPYPRTVHETILHRLESRSMPVSISDVVDGRIIGHDSSRLRDRILSASRALRSLGVSQGDRVGIIGLNSSRYMTLDVAIGRVGAVSVPIYYTSPPSEIEEILVDSKAKLLFVGSSEILDNLQELGLNIPLISFCREETVKATSGYLGWTEFLEKGGSGDTEDEIAPVGFDDLATIRYTSGTTGKPKGVCLSHANLRWMGETVSSLMPWRTRSREIRYLSFLPMNHVVEGIICAYAPYYAPARLNIFFLEDFKQLRKALPLVRPTVFFSVPRFYEKAWESLVETRIGRMYARSKGLPRTLLRPLVRRALLSKAGLERCEHLLVGSSPVSRVMLDEFAELGIEIHDAYGETEAPLVTMNLRDRNRIGTVGEPLPETAIKISEEGEILVKGPQVAQDYTKAKFPIDDGFLATGDLGRIEDGYLVVEGRRKELIKTSYGKYVQPAKIETMMRRIKNVDEAMVVGEGRPFCTALIWVKKGIDRAKATSTIDQAVLELDKQLSHPEQIKRWVTLDNDLTISGGDLTPSLKLRRGVISTRFRDEIERLYEGHKTSPIVDEKSGVQYT
ncbi:MAG TPA: AMP-binding protein [Candidatus Bathyarchaeia archaeon]|nr:AMP-binding protein [Candidatus Bathyarchaeia archaeon]